MSDVPFSFDRTAAIESRGNPNARNKSGATGIVQVMPSTAAGFGYTQQDMLDPNKSADVFNRLGKQNALYLQSRLGRAPTGAEQYIAWQQGAGGAHSILTADPSLPVSAMGDKLAKNMMNNPPYKGFNGTVGQWRQAWTDKYNGTPQVGYSYQGADGQHNIAFPQDDDENSIMSSANQTDGDNGTSDNMRAYTALSGGFNAMKQRDKDYTGQIDSQVHDMISQMLDDAANGSSDSFGQSDGGNNSPDYGTDAVMNAFNGKTPYLGSRNNNS